MVEFLSSVSFMLVPLFCIMNCKQSFFFVKRVIQYETKNVTG